MTPGPSASISPRPELARPASDSRTLRLRSKAPLRVSFAGGGTDVSPFPETEGGAVLSATIARYAYGSLTPRSDGVISLTSEDLGLQLQFNVDDPPPLNGRLDLIQTAVQRLAALAGGERGGYSLLVRCSVPPGSGLGSSSTVMVTLVGLLRERYGLQMDSYDVAHLAHRLEREELGITGGRQDQYAAVFGGFNYIEFMGDHVLVNPLRIREETVYELEHNLLLCFTRQTRSSSLVIQDQSQRVVAGNTETLEGLRAQKALATELKRALLHNRLQEFGYLLGQAWEQKKRMSPRITTPHIDETYAAAVKAGALGGKVTGAGGGGFMLLYCDFDRKQRVAERLRGMGVDVHEVVFSQAGLCTWSPG
jgi:D-glycero-alpha-D-manno-heptose-7-phosphate kinase